MLPDTCFIDKFLLNTAMLFSISIVCGCSHTTMAEFSYKRDHMYHNTENSYYLDLQKMSVCQPLPYTHGRHSEKKGQQLIVKLRTTRLGN